MIRPKIERPKHWHWVMEDDLPLTWDAEELANMRFKCSKKNFFLGNLPEPLYKQEVVRFRGRS